MRAETKRQIREGRRPELDPELDGPLVLGAVFVLEGSATAPELSVRILSVSRRGKVSYVVRDDRPRLLARQAGQIHPEQYTSVPAKAISEAGEAVPPDYQDLLVIDARRRFAQQEDRQRIANRQATQLALKLRRLVAEGARHGVDLTPRLAGMVREAEQEIAQRRRAA
jgi:hypothetical protein